MALRVGAAVLAAGGSRRLGYPKQLVRIGGVPLVYAIATELCAAPCADVAVVVGAHAERVAGAVADLCVACVPNPDWASGVASSIRAAAAWAMRSSCDALVIATCDQVKLTRAHVASLIAERTRRGAPVGSRYAGVVGVPAIFGAEDFVRLLGLANGPAGGDTGARSLLGDAAVDWPDGVVDVDTPADVASIDAR